MNVLGKVFPGKSEKGFHYLPARTSAIELTEAGSVFRSDQPLTQCGQWIIRSALEEKDLLERLQYAFKEPRKLDLTYLHATENRKR